MKIKEVADRSGFSPPTLRYYEEIGILPAPTRTPSGYRTYDERTLERLAFIARTKQLGCTLEEIAERLSDRFNLRRPVSLEMRECGEPSALWDQSTRKVTICYELCTEIERLYTRYAAQERSAAKKVGKKR